MRTCVQSGDVEVIHIPSTEQRADILTKSLEKEKFCYFRNLIGMYDVGTGKEIKGENVGKLISRNAAARKGVEEARS